MSSFPNKPDQLLIGVVMVSVNGNGGVVLDPVNNSVYASDYYINGNSINTSIGGIVNDVSDLEAGFSYLSDVVLPDIQNNQNDANTYFNDINVAIQGLDEAVENLQNEIANVNGGSANDAFNQANNAFNQANSAFNQVNTTQNQVNGLSGAVNFLINDFSNVSNLANSAFNQANSAFNQANGAFNQANGAFNTANGAFGLAINAIIEGNNTLNVANDAFNTANSAYIQANAGFNRANSAYNQANSATILAGSAYNQANSYLNSLNTNQIIVAGSEVSLGINMSVAPQVFFASNGSQGPVLRMVQQNGGDDKEMYISSSDITITHNYTSIGDPESIPYVLFSEPANSVSVSLHAGSVVPNFSAGPGSLYLQTSGDFYTYDGNIWTSQSLGATVQTKHLIVRDNPNSNTRVEIDPANSSGIYIQTNGGTESPSLTVDKFNSSSDGIAVLGHENLTITHVYSIEDQNFPYVQFFDSAPTALINASIYFGNNAPTHTSLVGNGSLFIQGGATPNLYQFNGTAWAGVGGGGGGSSVAQRTISVGSSVGQSLPNTARTVVTFDTTESNSGDTGAYFIWNGAGSRFEVINSGIYWVGAGLAVDYTATVPASQSAIMWVTINGSAVRAIDDFAVSNGLPDPMVMKAGRYLNLNAGAYLQVEVSQNFAGGSTINGDNTFLDLTYFEMSRTV